jgi:hypothetical protein
VSSGRQGIVHHEFNPEGAVVNNERYAHPSMASKYGGKSLCIRWSIPQDCLLIPRGKQSHSVNYGAG